MHTSQLQLSHEVEGEAEAEADAADQQAPGPSLVGGVLQSSTEGEG